MIYNAILLGSGMLEPEKKYTGSNSRTQYWEWNTAGHGAVFPSEMWIFTLHGLLAVPLRDPWPLSCLFMHEHFLTFLWCVQATMCLRMLSTFYSLWFDTTVVEYLNKTRFFSNVILASGMCMLVVCLSVGVLYCVSSQHGNVIVLPWCFPRP